VAGGWRGGLAGRARVETAGNWGPPGEGTDSLTDTSGLSGLTSIGGWLFVVGNDDLVDLDGLSALVSVAQDAWINDHESLVSIEGLSALASVGGDLQIMNNDDLCEDQATALAAAVTVGGATTLSGNTGTCP